MEYEDKEWYDIYSVKDRLIEYREREKEIKNQKKRADLLEAKTTSVGSPTLSDMPKSPSKQQSIEMVLSDEKMDLENYISHEEEQQKREKEAIEIILRKLKLADERAVIRMRYFDGLAWEDVSFMLFGDKEDFLGKEDTYLRRTHKIHGSALLNMAIIIVGENK